MDSELLKEFVNWMNSRWTPIYPEPIDCEDVSVSGFGLLPTKDNPTGNVGIDIGKNIYPFIWSRDDEYTPYTKEEFVKEAKKFFIMIIPGGKIYWRSSPRFEKNHTFEEGKCVTRFRFRCSIGLPDGY